MSEHGALMYVGHDECDRAKAYCCMACVLGNFACGWAFDAGMREAERDAFVVRVAEAAECESDDADAVVEAVLRVVREKYAFSLEAADRRYEMRARLMYPDEDIEVLVFGRDAAVSAAVAAERERCLAWAMFDKGVTKVASIGDKAIQSGAPAPREG